MVRTNDVDVFARDCILALTIPLLQSAIPAFVMGTLCIVGGVTGYARTRSIPSLVAGVGYVAEPTMVDHPNVTPP
jgi:Transmembrane proteins 14C